MDTAWPNEALSSAAQFNGLYDDLLSFDLPGPRPATQLNTAETPVTVQQIQAAEMNRKRKLELAEKESLEMYLAQLGSEEAPGSGVATAEGDYSMKRKDSGEKEAKLDTARNKACRERARRERLNDRCGHSRLSVVASSSGHQPRYNVGHCAVSVHNVDVHGFACVSQFR